MNVPWWHCVMRAVALLGRCACQMCSFLLSTAGHCGPASGAINEAAKRKKSPAEAGRFFNV